MTRAVTVEEFECSKDDLVRVAGKQTVLIQRDGETVAVLTSPQQYETTREAKAERVIKAMKEFGEHMQRVATTEELDALERELHQLAR